MTSRALAIVGPTASGKSEFAIQVALEFRGEIISFDSVSVYRGMDIGSGKPSLSARAGIPHHLIDCLDPTEEMNAAKFAERAGALIEAIAGRGGLPVLAGGTGLYLTALLKGLFPRGTSDPALRRRIESLIARRGSPRLHRLLRRLDPAYAAKTEPNDRVRVARALEVCFGRGQMFSKAQAEREPAFAGEVLLIGLNPGREELRKRVQVRVERMFADGLIDETRSLLARLPPGPRPRALGAIGYRQVVARLDREPHLAQPDHELQRAIVIATMQYAKRQMTYFRRQFDVEWFAAPDQALERVRAWVAAESIGARA